MVTTENSSTGSGDSEQTPAISVVVPTHRGAARLPVLLEALAAQDVSEPWEVVFSVDGVLDDTLEILRQWEGRLPLRCVVAQEPRGVVEAMEEGTRAARGRIVVRCDDDLRPAPDYVRRHLAHHPPGSRRGIVGATRDVWAEDNVYGRVYGAPANARGLRALYARDPDLAWMAWAANNSAPKDALLGVGGFDRRFVYGQDSELGYRLRHDAGLEIIIDPALETEHRGPAQVLANRAPRAYIAGASRKLFVEVHPEWEYPSSSPSGVVGRAWALAVDALARVATTRDAYARLGALGDAVLARVPTKIGEKLCALLVEAAGKAGRRYGSTDLSVYKGQKSAELRAERLA